MKVGIRDGMLPVSFEESFQKAKEIGFDGVEVCMGVNYREHLLWQDGGIDKVNSLAAAAGVEIPSLSPGGFTAYSFMHPTDSTRSEGIAEAAISRRDRTTTRCEGDSGTVFWERQNRERSHRRTAFHRRFESRCRNRRKIWHLSRSRINGKRRTAPKNY